MEASEGHLAQLSCPRRVGFGTRGEALLVSLSSRRQQKSTAQHPAPRQMSEAEFQKLIETMPRRRRRKRRRKAGKVTVTRADGTVEVVKPGAFRRRKKKQRRTSYENYLRSTHWKDVRRQVLMRDKHRCVDCGSRGLLQVHHLTYDRLGNERMTDLTTLCRSCHRRLHRG